MSIIRGRICTPCWFNQTPPEGKRDNCWCCEANHHTGHTDSPAPLPPKAEPEPFRIEDTCCGKCPVGTTCYVDQVTGA